MALAESPEEAAEEQAQGQRQACKQGLYCAGALRAGGRSAAAERIIGVDCKLDGLGPVGNEGLTDGGEVAVDGGGQRCASETDGVSKSAIGSECHIENRALRRGDGHTRWGYGDGEADGDVGDGDGRRLGAGMDGVATVDGHDAVSPYREVVVGGENRNTA